MANKMVAFGGYNELDFLTHININNNDNNDDIYNSVIGATGTNGNLTPNPVKNKTVVFKDKNTKGTNKIKQHYANSSTKSDVNPYLELIRDWSKTDNGNTYKSMKLQAADFAYLRDLGLYPMNRMWILRRYPEGTDVQNNLTEVTSTPIATVIGWIKPTEEQFLGVSFNESWTTINKRFDQVLFDIMEKEFGIKMSAMASLPGFTQGILFSFLQKMGLLADSNGEVNKNKTTYNAYNIPLGDPNLNTAAATRMTDGSVTGDQNLKSQLSFNLETVYEQKFIGDVDPGSAMLDILQNLKVMGTSDMNFIYNPKSKIIKSLTDAAKSTGTNQVNAWENFVKTTITSFLDALTEVLKSAVDAVGGKSGGDTAQNNTSSGSTASTTASANAAADGIRSILNNGLVNSILASTVKKWKWPLIGGIGVGTGQSTTPWHLTLGNPRNPFFSIGNMIVRKCELKFNNDFSFNDMPTRITASITVEQGRDLGGQEILMAFNNGVDRVYSTEDNGTLNSGDNTNKTIKTNK